MVAAVTRPVLGEPAGCSSSSEAVRQACRLAATIPKPDGLRSPVDSIGNHVTAPLSPDAFRHVSYAQLNDDPQRFHGQPIAVAGAQCFAFGVGDYRCVINGATPIGVVGAILIPPEAEVAIEQGCATEVRQTDGTCSHKIYFVPVAHETTKTSAQTMIVFRSANIMAAPEGHSDGQAGTIP